MRKLLFCATIIVTALARFHRDPSLSISQHGPCRDRKDRQQYYRAGNSQLQFVLPSRQMKLIGHRWQDQGGNCQHEQHSDHAGCVASELQHAVTDTARYYGSTEYQDCGGQDRADQRGLNKLH